MKRGRGGLAMSLPRFGDEQVALASETDSGSLLVRRAFDRRALEVAADGRLSLSLPRVRDSREDAAKQRGRIG